MPELTKPNLGSEPSTMHPSMDGRVLSLDVLGPLDLHDYSLQIKDGLITNNGATHADGPNGPVLSFADGEVNIGQRFNSLPGTYNFTIIITAASDVDSSSNAAFGFNGVDDLVLYPYDSGLGGRFRVFWRNKGASVLTPSHTLVGTGEHQFVFVSDGIASQKAYIDGELAESATDASAAGTFNADAFVGSFSAGSQRFLGTISHVNIYNRSLTAQEIKALYDDPWAAYRKDNILFMPQGGVTPPTGIPILRRRRECA
jgi:hypothetical protein